MTAKDAAIHEHLKSVLKMPGYMVADAVLHAGMLVRLARAEAGLSLEEVAQVAGWSPDYLRLLEAGKAPMDGPFVGRLARALAHCGKRLRLTVEAVE